MFALLLHLLFHTTLATDPHHPAAVSTPAFDTLAIEEPTSTPHGTLLVEERWKPGPSPYVLVTEDGYELPTQWDRVLSFRGEPQGDVVELTGYIEEPFTGMLRIRKAEEPQPRLGLYRFDPDALAIVAGLTPISVQVDDRPPVAITGPWPWIHRLGSNRITVGGQIDLGDLWALVWADIRAGSKEVRLHLTLHNCGLPARPDAYFDRIRVLAPQGFKAQSGLADSAGTGPPHEIVSALDDGTKNILPQQYRRPFRVIVMPENQEWAEYDGWGTTRWNRKPEGSTNPFERLGGFLPHSISVPDLSHTKPDLVGPYVQATTAMHGGAKDPLRPGSAEPPARLWPMRGVKYGGATGGVDITQCPGTLAAYFANPYSRVVWQVEQTRYACRQKGHILDEQGNPLPFQRVTNGEGNLLVKNFNNQFYRKGDDGPLGIQAAEEGDAEDGLSSYESELRRWQPIDEQHLIRWMRSNLVLLWLDNDPEAAHAIRSQAALVRMSMHNRVSQGPAWGVGKGTTWGRGEAWSGVCAATAAAITKDDTEEHDGLMDFLEAYAKHAADAQQPSGAIGRLQSGKVVKNWPIGHYFGVTNKPCAFGLHTDDPPKDVADYAAARSHEQIYLLVGMRSVRHLAGFGSVDVERGLCEAIRDLAWATDPDGSYRHGVLDRFPVARLIGVNPDVYGPLYKTREDVEEWDVIAGAGPWNATDSFQCGTVPGYAGDYGLPMTLALRGYTGQSDLAGMLDWFERQGLGNLGNRAVTLEVLQRFRK